MTSKFEKTKYETLFNDCGLAFKRVLKKDLTKNKLKHIEYTIALSESYNAFAAYTYEYYALFSRESQEQLKRNWKQTRDKLILCFGKILTRYDRPSEINSEIDIDVTLNHNFDGSELEEYGKITKTKSKFPSTSTLTEFETKSETNSNASSIANTDDFSEFENNTEIKMAQMTNIEFLNLASRTINRNYDGDPLSLNAFINSIELLSEFANDALKPFFIKFIKSKLEGKALECIPNETETIDVIINALKNQIKPDNSKVIAGRMLALRPDRAKLTEFSKQTEDLAEAFQRSLVIEGIPQNKAREMTIEKTIELCRNSARSDLVKSVLAASQFSSPKEVVAKFVIENATENTERQVLAYQRSNKQNNNGYNNNNQRGNNRNNRYNNNNNRFNNRGNRPNNNRGNYRNNYNRNSNNRYNNNGRNNNGHNNNNNNNNRGNGNQNNSNRYNNVRYAENLNVPQIQLGDAEIQH